MLIYYYTKEIKFTKGFSLESLPLYNTVSNHQLQSTSIKLTDVNPLVTEITADHWRVSLIIVVDLETHRTVVTTTIITVLLR